MGVPQKSSLSVKLTVSIDQEINHTAGQPTPLPVQTTDDTIVSSSDFLQKPGWWVGRCISEDSVTKATLCFFYPFKKKSDPCTCISRNLWHRFCLPQPNLPTEQTPLAAASWATLACLPSLLIGMPPPKRGHGDKWCLPPSPLFLKSVCGVDSIRKIQLSKAESIQNCHCSLTLLPKKSLHLLLSLDSSDKILACPGCWQEETFQITLHSGPSGTTYFWLFEPLTLLQKLFKLPCVNFLGLRCPQHIILGSWKIPCDSRLNQPPLKPNYCALCLS